MSLSLSNLFAAAPASGGTAGGLFSESAKQKFARVYKPEEFDIPTKKAPEPVEDEGDDVEPLDGKKKKRKERKRKPVEGTTEEGATAPAPTEEGAKGAEGGDLSTIFVGNVPVSETVKSLTKYFKVYGEIENIRLRSVPVAGAKVDEAGNQDLVKKVCVNAKKFGEQKGSFNAYIKFKEAASATAALAANNQVMGIRHIRVDRSTPSLFDPKRSVFLGGLPHYADEEDIRDFFAEVGFCLNVMVPALHSSCIKAHIILLEFRVP
jgi:nucleolar protein 12